MTAGNEGTGAVPPPVPLDNVADLAKALLLHKQRGESGRLRVAQIVLMAAPGTPRRRADTVRAGQCGLYGAKWQNAGHFSIGRRAN